MEPTRAAIGEDDANSWLPFTGRDDLKEAVTAYIERRGGPRYDGRREIVITSGEGDARLDALFCLTDPGDEVVLTGIAMAFKLIESAPARWRAVNPPTWSRWSEPAETSRTANSSNDPTSQEVKLKSRDTLIHTC